MNELTIKLILILLPGAIATIIFGKLILHKEWDSFKFGLFSVLFGIFSYFIFQLYILFFNIFKEREFSDLSIWGDLTDAKSIPYGEIIIATIISVLLSLFVSYVHNRKVIENIAKAFDISNKYGDENLFSRFLNSDSTEYVYLRDIKNNLTYYGWVKSFSETDTVSEIRLANVTVYSYTESTEYYSVSEVYLSFNKHDIIIEIANP